MATIKFNQQGLESPGEWDKSRDDGTPNGADVSVITSEPGIVELLWAPIADDGVALGSLHQVAPTVWVFTPNTNVYGTYRVRFTPTSNPSLPTIRLFAILTPTLALRAPALNEISSPNASLINAGPTMVAASEFNREGEGPFDDGNFGGSYSALEKLFLAVETLARTAAQAAAAASAIYPIEKFTPGDSLGEAQLTDANIAQAIRNAISQAQTDGGGDVVIPRGQWMVGDEEIELVAVSRSTWIRIRGAGMDRTTLIYPDAYTGTAFKFSGVNEPYFLFNGGMEDLTITCLTDNVENTGTGLHLEACINTQFKNITIRNFTGGTGLKTRRVGEGGTNQYVQLYNFTVAGCDTNYDLEHFVNCDGYGVYSTAAQTHDFWIDDSKFDVFGGNMQSSCDVSVLMSGVGGSRVAFHGYYWEGVNAGQLMFQCEEPSSTYNTLEVNGFHVGGEPGTFLDCGAFTNVTLANVHSIGACDTILKARNGPNVTLINCGDPISSPGKFDLDATSRATLVCLGFGTQFSGGRSTAEKGVSLASHVEGAEPGSPVAGDLLFNSTSVRPRVYDGAAHRDLSFVDDASDLSGILAPFAAEIFDPSIFRTVTLADGDTTLDVLTGVLHGTTASAPDTDQRPAWNASDAYFGGKPSFTCDRAAEKYLQGTLAATIATGHKPALFVVYRVPGGADDPSHRRVAILIEHAADHGSAFAIGQSDLNSPSHSGYSFGAASNGFSGIVEGVPGTDAWGHAAYTGQDSLLRYSRDLEATVAGLTPGTTATVVDIVTLGGVWNSLDYDGCDITIAYAAVLHTSLPFGTRDKALKAALARYNLR